MPLACGHRDPLDCDNCLTANEQQADEPTPRVDAPDVSATDLNAVDPTEIVGQWWSSAKERFLAREFPQYGSKQWRELPVDDPRRLAAVLDAAECWRKYGPDLIEDLNDVLRARPPISSGSSLAELDQAARPKEPWELRATPGWPAVAIPGKPGRYLTCQEMRRAA